MSEYSNLSKEELEELGRKYGVELDRRLLKSKMVKQLDDHISSLSKDELEELAREDGVELDKRLTKEKLVEQVADIGEESTEIDLSDEEKELIAKLQNLNF
jgi:transposase